MVIILCLIHLENDKFNLPYKFIHYLIKQK